MQSRNVDLVASNETLSVCRRIVVKTAVSENNFLALWVFQSFLKKNERDNFFPILFPSSKNHPLDIRTQFELIPSTRYRDIVMPFGKTYFWVNNSRALHRFIFRRNLYLFSRVNKDVREISEAASRVSWIFRILKIHRRKQRSKQLFECCIRVLSITNQLISDAFKLGCCIYTQGQFDPVRALFACHRQPFDPFALK